MGRWGRKGGAEARHRAVRERGAQPELQRHLDACGPGKAAGLVRESLLWMKIDTLEDMLCRLAPAGKSRPCSAKLLWPTS